MRARMLAAAVAVALATVAQAGLVAGTGTSVAYADHGGPSAGQVAASKARVARLERKVAAAADAVSQSQAALDRLRTAAEVAVEAFNKAQVKQAEAVHSLDAARLVVAAANARVGAVRGDVSKFAVAAYEGGPLSTVNLLLSSRGPDTMLYRLGALDAVSRSQRDVMQNLSAAEVYQRAVQQQAAGVLLQSQRAATAANDARRHAAQLVADQATGVARLTAAENQLSTMLTNARAHASALEQARLQALALARAKAEAARKAAALRAARDRANQQSNQQSSQQSSQPSSQPSSQQHGGPGPSHDFGSTVSAATEQAALQQAESQLGKPYEWGASGPDTYDCSGLVMWSYAQVGEHVDHWTGDQWNEGAHIPLSALRAGDLLFFATDTNDPNTIHHVGMYVGSGQMIEAPYTGANVRYSDAFRPDLIGAVRLYKR